jgi:threonine synthase
MKIADLPGEIQGHILPKHTPDLYYRCLGCGEELNIDKLHYTCPLCGSVLLIDDRNFHRLQDTPGEQWRQIYDYRKVLNIPALHGVYLFHEFIGPNIPLEHVVYLGEGHTPVIEANRHLQDEVGMPFYFKNDGQNPSASFKDRGMASALSFINHLVRSGTICNVLAVCASTGDTAAAAALYAAYLQPEIKSAVLLPHKKVTPQQLSQPLGNGARVYEIPGVFDDCMKVVEALSEQYNVALLNSKNAWRILGQESFAYEIAQAFEYDVAEKAVVVPIGNAGNITAVMSGFLKFHAAGIIDRLPKIIGVQSEHANPVYRYYSEANPASRNFKPVVVKASVAQAAMIGNPVSMPRVIELVRAYDRHAGQQRVFFTEVTEQAIMDWELIANRNGHIACTHGGETLAGLKQARDEGLVGGDDTAILDSTAHALKFAGFQEMYFSEDFPAEFGVKPRPALINHPVLIHPEDLEQVPAPGHPLQGDVFEHFVERTCQEIANDLGLTPAKQTPSS